MPHRSNLMSLSTVLTHLSDWRSCSRRILHPEIIESFLVHINEERYLSCQTIVPHQEQDITAKHNHLILNSDSTELIWSSVGVLPLPPLVRVQSQEILPISILLFLKFITERALSLSSVSICLFWFLRT